MPASVNPTPTRKKNQGIVDIKRYDRGSPNRG